MEKLDLSGFFTTQAQAADFSSRLARVAEEVYKTQFNLEQILLESVGVQKKDRFMTLLRDNNITAESNTAIREFITKIRDMVSSLPVLTLTIAFEPNEKILKSIAEWFQINLSKQVLLDVHIDTGLIAGATLSIGGRYFDFSIKNQFSDILNGIVVKTFQSMVVNKQSPPSLLGGHQSIEHITFAR